MIVNSVNSTTVYMCYLLIISQQMCFQLKPFDGSYTYKYIKYYFVDRVFYVRSNWKLREIGSDIRKLFLLNYDLQYRGTHESLSICIKYYSKSEMCTKINMQYQPQGYTWCDQTITCFKLMWSDDQLVFNLIYIVFNLIYIVFNLYIMF